MNLLILSMQEVILILVNFHMKWCRPSKEKEKRKRTKEPRASIWVINKLNYFKTQTIIRCKVLNNRVEVTKHHHLQKRKRKRKYPSPESIKTHIIKKVKVKITNWLIMICNQITISKLLHLSKEFKTSSKFMIMIDKLMQIARNQTQANNLSQAIQSTYHRMFWIRIKNQMLENLIIIIQIRISILWIVHRFKRLTKRINSKIAWSRHQHRIWRLATTTQSSFKIQGKYSMRNHHLLKQKDHHCKLIILLIEDLRHISKDNMIQLIRSSL